MATYGDKPFGLHMIKVYPLPSGTGVRLNVEQTLKFKERTRSGQLSGGDALVAVASLSEAADFELGAGGIPLEAYATMTGRTVTVSGSTPNEKTTLTGEARHPFPYFQIQGQVLGVEDDDVHIVLYKAKILDGLEGSFQDGQFFTSGAKGIAVDDDVNGVWDLIQHETATAIATSLP